MEITTKQIETAVKKAREIPNGRGAIVISRYEYLYVVCDAIPIGDDPENNPKRTSRNSFTFPNGFQLVIVTCIHRMDVERLRGVEWSWLVVDGLVDERVREELDRIKVLPQVKEEICP